MTLAHLHLLLNHFPIIGTIIGLGLFIIALIAKSDHLKQASLLVLLGIAMLAFPTYLSGTAAAEEIAKLPGVSEDLIKAHQNSALLAFIFMEITGSFAWAFVAYTICEVIVLIVLLVLAREPAGSVAVQPASAH